MPNPGEWDPENEDPTKAQKKMLDEYLEKVRKMMTQNPHGDFGQIGTGASGTGSFVEAFPVHPDLISIEKIENGYLVQTNPMAPLPTRRVYCANLAGLSEFLYLHFVKAESKKDDERKG